MFKQPQHLVFILMRHTIRLAQQFEPSLKEMSAVVQLAHYDGLSQRGHKQKEIADKLGVSVRKVAELARRLREFAAADEVAGIPRRVELMLWFAPASVAWLKRVLPAEESEAIENAIKTLLAEGRIRAEDKGGQIIYAVSRGNTRLVSDNLTARLDGVNNLVTSVVNTIYDRFFTSGTKSFARTVSFRIRPADLPELRSLYEDALWQGVQKLERQAHDDPDAELLDLSICWSPSTIAMPTNN